MSIDHFGTKLNARYTVVTMGMEKRCEHLVDYLLRMFVGTDANPETLER